MGIIIAVSVLALGLMAIGAAFAFVISSLISQQEDE